MVDKRGARQAPPNVSCIHANLERNTYEYAPVQQYVHVRKKTHMFRNRRTWFIYTRRHHAYIAYAHVFVVHEACRRQAPPQHQQHGHDDFHQLSPTATTRTRLRIYSPVPPSTSLPSRFGRRWVLVGGRLSFCSCRSGYCCLNYVRHLKNGPKAAVSIEKTSSNGGITPQQSLMPAAEE